MKVTIEFLSQTSNLYLISHVISQRKPQKEMSLNTEVFSDYYSAPVAVVDEPREDFQPVKSRKRKSKETQMETVTDGKFS